MAFWASRLIENTTGRSPWHRRVQRLVHQTRPDLIHAHFADMGFWMLPIAKELGIPLVTTMYAWDTSVLSREKAWKSRLQQLFAGGDLFLVEGPHLSELVMDLGVPEEKLQIQHIAIDPDNYPSWQPSWPVPTILFAGRLVEKKGVIYALKAMRRLRQDLPAVQLRIIGDGPEMPRAQAYVKRHGLEACVLFLGMRPHKEMIEELVRANVLVYPSVWAWNGDNEGGVGTALLEAQMVGTPIVSTYHADLAYGLADVPGIYLTTERFVEGLAEKLRLALVEQVRVDDRFVRERHNVSQEIVRLETKYDELLRRAQRVR